jgi:chromosome segregation ATPase
MSSRSPRPRPRQIAPWVQLIGALISGALVLVGLSARAPAQSLEEIQNKIDASRARLDDKQSQLQHAKDRAGVLSTQIQEAGDQLDQLRGEVATLQNRIAIVQTHGARRRRR